MLFITDLHLEKIDGLLDSEESIRDARITLERSTEEAYKEFDEAKLVVLEDAHRKLLD